LNKRVLSSITIIVLATLAILPAIPIKAHAVIPASLSVSPTVLAGNPGDTFAITVAVDQVAALIAYDVQLNYNGLGLHVMSVDFSGPFAGSGCNTLPVIESFNDAVGFVRAAVTTFNGCTVDVPSATSVFVVNFQVAARENSPFHISTDTECACSSLAQFVNSNIVTVAHTTSDGNFFAEPNIIFHTTYNITTTPRNVQLKTGVSSVTISSILLLPRGELLTGFAYIVYDVITPSGKDISITSPLHFLAIGTSATITVTFSFGTEAGTYSTFGTIWRGSTPSTIVQFATLSGQNFHVF
jgi:hypothetical protein